jgi:hypothetical protein
MVSDGRCGTRARGRSLALSSGGPVTPLFPRHLSSADLVGPEAYAREREARRAEVISHQSSRRVAVGPHVALEFEDRLTVLYQVQERLRIGRLFEPEAVAAELDAHNPLIPDGTNLKATMLVEIPDPDDHERALVRLRGIEHLWFLELPGRRVLAIAEEHRGRSYAGRHPTVHYLRFELGAGLRERLTAGPAVIRVAHPAYTHEVDLGPATRLSLATDLDS